MKPYFLPSAAVLALSVTLPAHAQSSYDPGYSKGDDRIFNDSRRMEAEETRPARTSTVMPAREEPAPQIEPAAGRDNNPYDDFTGFYGGGDIGYAIGSAEINDPAGPDGDVGMDGFNGDLFLGYGFEHNFSWLGGYGGIELAYEWSGEDGDLGGTGYDKDHAFNATFRPGLSMHKDTLGYGIIGYSRAQFESGSDDEYLDGLILGAGAEFDTNTAFKTRLEYTYTNYEDENIGGNGFDAHENNIKLGVVFRL